jgi:hypothetical protein
MANRLIQHYPCIRIYRRFLYFEAVKSCKDRGILFQLKNNITINQSLSDYCYESWQTLISDILKSNMMYVYVDKAKLDNNGVYPGHILSFVTDGRNPKRSFSTRAFENDADIHSNTWKELWINFSESEKLQNALITDEPLDSEMSYYKGKALSLRGLEYAEDAISAYRDGLKMSTNTEHEWQSKLKNAIKILELRLEHDNTR